MIGMILKNTNHRFCRKLYAAFYYSKEFMVPSDLADHGSTSEYSVMSERLELRRARSVRRNELRRAPSVRRKRGV